jgi:hypothetical protein
MASKNQFDVFKSLYEEDIDRSSTLGDHAKTNLSLATFYSAFILFGIGSSKPEDILGSSIIGLAIIFMFFSFLFSLFATQITRYEAASNPKKILEAFGDKPPLDDDFFDDRIIDFTYAYGVNSRINDRKATQLWLARYFLLTGITFHLSFFVIRLM